MLKAIRVSAMLLALAAPTYAGEMLTPPAPQPPPARAFQEHANVAQEPATPATTEDGTKASVTQIALDLLILLQSLL